MDILKEAWVKEEIELAEKKGKGTDLSGVEQAYKLIAGENEVEKAQALLRLARYKNLAPITEEDFDYSHPYQTWEDGSKSYVCKRNIKIWIDKSASGETLGVHEINRCAFFAQDMGGPRMNSIADSIIDEICPIELPYMQSDAKITVIGLALQVDLETNEAYTIFPGEANCYYFKEAIRQNPKTMRIETMRIDRLVYVDKDDVNEIVMEQKEEIIISAMSKLKRDLTRKIMGDGNGRRDA